jgi:hypothetical protein
MGDISEGVADTLQPAKKKISEKDIIFGLSLGKMLSAY